MSPEQCTGKRAVDGRSDLYSLGVMLFELLSGTRPFDADSVHGLLLAHVSEPPPDLATLRPGVPPALAAITARLLAKRPEDRFQSAGEVVHAIDAAMATTAAAAGAETVNLGASGGGGAAGPGRPLGGPVRDVSVSGGPGAGEGRERLQNSVALTPPPVVVTPLSPPPPRAPVVTPVAPGVTPFAPVSSGAVVAPDVAAPTPAAPADEPGRLPRGYRNPLSWMLWHASTFTAVLALASVGAGVFCADRLELLSAAIHLAILPGLALTVAVFAPRVGAPLAAALLPTGLFTISLVIAANVEVNDSDHMVAAGITTGAYLVLAIVAHVVTRLSGGVGPLSLAGLTIGLLAMGTIAGRVPDSPFTDLVYRARVERGRRLEATDRVGALAQYEAAIAGRAHGHSRPYNVEDARFLAARLHVGGDRPPFDAVRGEVLLLALLEGYYPGVTPEERAFGVRHFGAAGEIERALSFIPEGRADEMSIGSDLSDESLAKLYFELWKLCRERGLEAWAERVQERASVSTDAFARLMAGEPDFGAHAPGPHDGVVDPFRRPPRRPPGDDEPDEQDGVWRDAAPEAPPLGPRRRKDGP